MSNNPYLLIVLIFSLACKNPKVQPEPPQPGSETIGLVKQTTTSQDSEVPQLTLSKLEGALLYDWSEFEDFAITNNFTFDEFRDEAGETSKAYKNSNSGLIKIVENRADDSLTKVWYMFNSQTNYTYYKQQLITTGYQFTGQDGRSEGPVSVATMKYLKDPISAELVTMKYGENMEYWLILKGKRRY